MDPFEALKAVYNRIKESEPEHIAMKIVAYICLQEDGVQEMFRLALGSDNLIHTAIHNAKIDLGIYSIPKILPPISPSVPFASLSPPLSQPLHSRWLTRRGGTAYPDQLHDFNYANLPQLVGTPELLSKTCYFYDKGFCWHGNDCRYLHGTSGYLQGFDEVASEDQFFSPRSLEKLEMEITEILKSRRGNPISIASLPMTYYEKYGRTLQAEGYLTESQRHGKAGYNLTKLLARMRNSVRLIDRPHGQHCVILAEDAPKYIVPPCERNDLGPIVSRSRQIYLTFPAESTFTDEEVSDYFSTFGPVQDVRIPCQEKRMFGFVTFDSAETVKMILSQGNPHYVCGARVLVKPYREKPKLVERKQSEKLENSIIYNGVDMDAELKAGSECSRMLYQKLIDEPVSTGSECSRMLYQKLIDELQRMHLSKLQLAPSPPPPTSQSYFEYSMDDLKVSQDDYKFPPSEHFNNPFVVLENGEDDSKHVDPIYFDQSNQGLNLPESPTTSTGASTAT